MDTSKVKVEIFGNTYSIRGDAPADYIRSLAEFVDRKMMEVSESTGSSSQLQIAILAALNIADEYFQLNRKKTGMEGALEEKTRMLISMLDEGLIGDILSRMN